MSSSTHRPPPPRWFFGLAIVAMAGFGVAGVLMLCDAVGLVAVPTAWVALATAPALLLGLLGYRYELPVAVPDEVVVDGDGVHRLSEGRVVEAIAWSRLTWVGIVTTSYGPGGEDFYWLLGREDGGGCAVGSEEAGRVGLLERLQRLPGFDNRAVIVASGCTDDASFPCWKGEAGDGLVCAAP